MGSGPGTDVIITEVSAVRALEAVMDGFRIMPAGSGKNRAAVHHVTGNRRLRKEHFDAMPSGAILANSGHFNVEIDIGPRGPAKVKRRPGSLWMNTASTRESGSTFWRRTPDQSGRRRGRRPRSWTRRSRIRRSRSSIWSESIRCRTRSIRFPPTLIRGRSPQAQVNERGN